MHETAVSGWTELWNHCGGLSVLRVPASSFDMSSQFTVDPMMTWYTLRRLMPLKTAILMFISTSLSSVGLEILSCLSRNIITGSKTSL